MKIIRKLLLKEKEIQELYNKSIKNLNEMKELVEKGKRANKLAQIEMIKLNYILFGK